MATILVSEDEQTILEALVEFLEMEGHTVLAASDGMAARELLESHVPDLVLTDLMMPRLDGTQLLQWIRDQPALAHVPVVLMSATGPPQLSGRPATLFVPKPFDLDVLLRVITASITGGRRGAAAGQ